MEQKSLSDWLAVIASQHPEPIDFGLDRISQVARALPLRKFEVPIVLVTGTNGKGSVTKLLESIYQAAGYQTALYTSPHLVNFRERLQINAAMVAEDQWVQAFQKIETARDNISLTFFEWTTLAAFFIVQSAKIDVFIVEVGMGGRLDACNILDADVAVVTSIALDHMEYLGDTRAQIAQEKAGIFREHCAVVSAEPFPPAVLEQQALSLKAYFYQIHRDFGFKKEALKWSWWGPQSQYENLPETGFKIENRAAALMVIEVLQSRLHVTDQSVQQGLATAYLPGRFEKIKCQGQLIYLDVAHNPHAASWLVEQMKCEAEGASWRVVLGMLEDKDIEGFVAILSPCVDTWYTTSLPTARSASTELLQAIISQHSAKPCYNFVDPVQALQQILLDTASSKKHKILVVGSFYTVGAALAYLREGDERRV